MTSEAFKPFCVVIFSIFINYSIENFQFPYIELEKLNKNYDFISEESINVGFVWRGSRTNSNDHYRSIKKNSLLIDFLKQKKVNFISLQYGMDSEEDKILGDFIFNTNGIIEDFEDTANIIRALDLVISVDTSVAHLAGALNIPCWVMLPDINSDWRWQENKSNTGWYPSVRIFRNENEEGWAYMLKQVKIELEKLL